MSESNILSTIDNVSWFVFDKVYPADTTNTALQEFAQNDGVMPGRYVCIRGGKKIYRKEYNGSEFEYATIFDLGDIDIEYTAKVDNKSIESVDEEGEDYLRLKLDPRTDNLLEYDENGVRVILPEINTDTVKFTDDLTITNPIGVITQKMIDDNDGSVQFSARNKSVSEVFSSLLSEAKDPSVDTPSVSFSASGGSGEVGTSYTLPTATLKVTDVGSYTYGSKDTAGTKYDASDTGVIFAKGDMSVKFGSNTVKNTSNLTTNGSISVQATDTEALYTDSVKKYKFSATAKYTESDRVPLNNLGNKVNSKKITTASITIEDKEVSFTGWRKMFMGTITDASANITSDVIRGLTLITEKAVTKTAKTFTVPVGATKIIVAFPASLTSKEPTFEYFTMSWEGFSGFIKEAKTIDVADARGEENGLKAYTVYTFTHSSPSGFEAATQYRVTLNA